VILLIFDKPIESKTMVIVKYLLTCLERILKTDPLNIFRDYQACQLMVPNYVEVILLSKVLKFKLLNTLEFTSKRGHILVGV